MGAGTGGHHHRHQLPASAADVLPVAWVVEAAKRAAARACAERAGLELIACWQAPDEAARWIGHAPLIALAALGEACVDVGMGRLARCLGLDPLDGPDALKALREAEPGVGELVDLVVLAIGGGR